MQTDTEVPLGRLIYSTARDIHTMAEKILTPHGLTVEQMHLLKNVTSKNGMTQKMLGSAVDKTPANLTRILRRLETKDLIVRRPESGDRRENLVFLTGKGRDLVKDVHETFQLFSARMFNGISDETQRTVRSCMEKMQRNIKEMAMDNTKE